MTPNERNARIVIGWSTSIALTVALQHVLHLGVLITFSMGVLLGFLAITIALQDPRR